MQAEPKVSAQTLVMTLVSGARSAGQRERCGQKNCKTLALSVVVHVCRYADVLHTSPLGVFRLMYVRQKVQETDGLSTGFVTTSGCGVTRSSSSRVMESQH